MDVCVYVYILLRGIVYLYTLCVSFREIQFIFICLFNYVFLTKSSPVIGTNIHLQVTDS